MDSLFKPRVAKPVSRYVVTGVMLPLLVLRGSAPYWLSVVFEERKTAGVFIDTCSFIVPPIANSNAASTRALF